MAGAVETKSENPDGGGGIGESGGNSKIPTSGGVGLVGGSGGPEVCHYFFRFLSMYGKCGEPIQTGPN